MNLFCVSLPGRFGDWCDAAIMALATSVLGSVVPTGGSTAEELASELITSEGQNYYIGARHPSGWLREKLVAANRKFVVALDDPRYAVRDLIDRHNFGMVDAVRHVASSCARISRYLALPGALVVNAQGDWDAPVATLTAIAAHLGLAGDPAVIARIVAQLDAAGVRRSEDAAPPAGTELDPGLVEGALGGYGEYFATGALRPIQWGRELFYAENHQAPVHPIELSGKIRYLLFGPLIALPPGSWTAELVLGFSDDAIDTGFRVEAWAGSLLASASIQPPRAGIFPADLSFVLEEANEGLVEIRVVNERAAIFGRLALGHATLTPRQGVPPSMTESLRLELGLAADGTAVRTDLEAGAEGAPGSS
jgi:hypothetical protein